jgi:hypothetical protein
VQCLPLEVAPELGVAVQSVTLTNQGSEPAPPSADVSLLLPLSVTDSATVAGTATSAGTVAHCPWAWSFGGGLTASFYPRRV